MPPRTARASEDGAVFLLYAVLIGLVIGLASGGSAWRLGELRIRWAPLVAIGIGTQVLLFSTPLGDGLGSAAPGAYVASNVAVLLAVARNLAIPGLPLVLVGGACNLVAICANGGYMPASAQALEALGWSSRDGYSNSRLSDGAVLAPLTDLFAMPAWLPLANIFSIGDVLIGVGVAMAVVTGMRAQAAVPTAPPASRSSGPA